MVHSASPPEGIVRFGVFELNLRSGELRKAGVRLTLPDQPLAVLKTLLERPGELVTREELRQRLWPGDTFVDFEHGLNAAVKRLRDALGDSADTPRFIETLPRRGYRLVAPVQAATLTAQPEHAVDASAAAATGEPALRPRRWLPWVAAGALAVLAVAIFDPAFRRAEAPRDAIAGQPGMTRLTDDAGLTTQPTLSADGELLAYASDRSGDNNLDIWLQRIDGGAAVRLTTHPADDEQPSLSPDGSQIAFYSKRGPAGIYIMPAHSKGEPKLIAPGGLRPRFSPDGKWVAYQVGGDLDRRGGDSDSSGMNRIYLTTPAGRPSTHVAPEFDSALHPVWSPDGTHLLFWGRRSTPDPDSRDWWVVPIGGGRAVRTGLIEILNRKRMNFLVQGWIGPDLIVGVSGNADANNVWLWWLSPAAWRATAHGRQITAGTDRLDYVSAAGNRLVFAAHALATDVWGLPLNADSGTVTGPPQPVTRSAMFELRPAISSDGRMVSFSAPKPPEGSAVWVKDLSRDETRQVVPPGAIDWPALSPDGARLAYRRLRAPLPAVIESVALNDGHVEQLCNRCGWAIPQDWSSDGRWLLHLDNRDGRMYVAALNLASGESVPIVRHDSANLYQGHFSPDGRWVVFIAVRQPRSSRLWIAPFREAPVPQTEWVAVTEDDTWEDKPRWSPNGALIYFVSERDGMSCIWAQRIQHTSKQPLGEPFGVHHAHSARLSIGNVGNVQEISVARDRIVFNMGDLTGNIWSLPLTDLKVPQ